MTTNWQDKAHSLIAEMAKTAYRQAGNRPGKKHKPYSLPPIAQELVITLGQNNEEKAKALFFVAEVIPALGC